jgi:hypothetical protein
MTAVTARAICHRRPGVGAFMWSRRAIHPKFVADRSGLAFLDTGGGYALDRRQSKILRRVTVLFHAAAAPWKNL